MNMNAEFLKIIVILAYLGISTFGIALLVAWALNRFDPDTKSNPRANSKIAVNGKYRAERRPTPSVKERQEAKHGEDPRP
jgi:hypothetical protein